MAQFNSLTDRVRQMLGGMVQQAPKTLSDIGNAIMPNFSASMQGAKTLGQNVSYFAPKVAQAAQQFVQQPDKFNQTLGQNIKRPGLGAPLTVPSFIASNTINATGNLLQKGIPSALKIGSYISPGLSSARMSGVYPQLNTPIKGSDVLNVAGLAGIPKVGANIIGGGIGTTFKVGENALMRKPLDQGLGEAYRQGYQFSAQLAPVEKLTSWIASPTIKALSNKFPVFNKVVNKLTPGEVKDFTTWVTESLKQGNKSGLAMSVFGALQDSKNGQETLKNIWDQYKMGFVFGAGGKAVGNLKPGVIDPLREKLKPMTLDQKVANQGGFVKLAPGEKPTLEQLKADIANQAKNKPNSFNPMEDLPGTRPGLRAEFDNAISRKDVETIHKLLPEVPEAYKKQVGKYLDPLLATPSVKRINILKQPRSEKVAQEMLKKGTIDTPKYNEIAGREGFRAQPISEFDLEKQIYLEYQKTNNFKKAQNKFWEVFGYDRAKSRQEGFNETKKILSKFKKNPNLLNINPEMQFPVKKGKPMTLSDAEKQAKLHEQAIEQTYKTRDASVDELEALLRTPDAELKGGYKIEKGGGQPTFPIKGKGDDPKTFRGIINKYFGGKQNIKLTQYEQVKPIANVKFTDDGAKQAIRAIESGDTANLTPQAQEYVTNLRKSFDQVRSEAVADGLPIGYVDNYLTHYWQQDPATVQAVINKLRTSGAFQKERTFLTYQEGIDAGLTPRFQNPTQILGNYVRQVENVRNNLKLVKALEGNNFIVSGDARKITPGVREIAIPGFDGKFAKPEIAQFIENLFEPRQANKILSTLGNISGKIQDVTLSGGIPGTPFNAFSISANLQKHFLAGRFTGPVKSFARAFSPESTTKYFNENIPAIREIQGAGYNLPTTLSYNKLMGDDTTGVGKVWNMAVSDPTFKRFIPMLQIDLYKEVKNKALKQGLSAEQAVEKGIQVLKNFEGMSDQFSRAASDPNAQAAIRTVFFAPKFRKAIIDIWVNSIKALKNPLALENQYNVRFLAGSILAFAGYNAANAYFNNGKMMWENGRNKEDKLIIPDGKGGQIGIPFLSSLATIPRGIARQALKVAKGDVSGAATDAGQTYLSSGIKPIADVAANQDYFGKTISPPDSQNKWGDILKYLGKSYASHPYIKELIDPANMVDPAYQRLSRAMELPFRFYDKKSVEGSKYYEARDKALEGMNEIEKKAYDAIPKYDANNPNTQIFKYQTFLTYPNVFEAKRMTEFNLAKQTGKPIDPLYLVNYDTAKAYMRYETLPPGSQDRKDLVKAKPELAALFDVRSKYFDENPIEGQTTSNRPLPSAYVQQQMDAKNWKDPQVRAYLDANTQYQNEQRAKLGLTPLAGFTPYAKKPKKVSIKLAKMKTPKIKSVKIKLPKIKKPKTLKLKKYTVKLSK